MVVKKNRIPKPNKKCRTKYFVKWVLNFKRPLTKPKNFNTKIIKPRCLKAQQNVKSAQNIKIRFYRDKQQAIKSAYNKTKQDTCQKHLFAKQFIPSGPRKFFMISYQNMIKYYSGLGDTDKHFHEVCQNNSPTKIFLDLDCKISNTPLSMHFPSSCMYIVELLIKFVKKQFGVKIHKTDVLFLSATRKEKHSMHIVFPNILVTDTLATLSLLIDFFISWATIEDGKRVKRLSDNQFLSEILGKSPRRSIFTATRKKNQWVFDAMVDTKVYVNGSMRMAYSTQMYLRADKLKEPSTQLLPVEYVKVGDLTSFKKTSDILDVDVLQRSFLQSLQPPGKLQEHNITVVSAKDLGENSKSHFNKSRQTIALQYNRLIEKRLLALIQGKLCKIEDLQKIFKDIITSGLAHPDISNFKSCTSGGWKRITDKRMYDFLDATVIPAYKKFTTSTIPPEHINETNISYVKDTVCISTTGATIRVNLINSRCGIKYKTSGMLHTLKPGKTQDPVYLIICPGKGCFYQKCFKNKCKGKHASPIDGSFTFDPSLLEFLALLK